MVGKTALNKEMKHLNGAYFRTISIVEWRKEEDWKDIIENYINVMNWIIGVILFRINQNGAIFPTYTSTETAMEMYVGKNIKNI